jgi:hypothetical protein
MKERLVLVLAAGVLVGFCSLSLVAVPPAAAHTIKKVGAYQFVVGWGAEPAYAGQLNSVQLVLTRLSTGKPVVNLGTSLTVTVIYGSRRMPMALTPTFDPDTGFGTPGDYRAWFFPTAPGTYTFQFTGKIGSQAVNESFTSGPTTFSMVEDPITAQFPVKVPTTAQLAQRLAATTPAPSSGGRTLGIIGIVMGALGLVAGGGALLSASGRATGRRTIGEPDQ